MLREYSKDFLQWVETGRLEADSRRYYRNGWRLLEQTKIAAMRMDQITKDEVEKLEFPGSASNGNNALRTLRSMFSKAKEHKMIFEVPDFALFKEHGRSLRLNDEAEKEAVSGGRPAAEGHHRGDARHRNAQRPRTLLRAGGEGGLRCRDDLHAGQQYGVCSATLEHLTISSWNFHQSSAFHSEAVNMSRSPQASCEGPKLHSPQVPRQRSHLQ